MWLFLKSQGLFGFLFLLDVIVCHYNECVCWLKNLTFKSVYLFLYYIPRCFFPFILPNVENSSDHRLMLHKHTSHFVHLKPTLVVSGRTCSSTDPSDTMWRPYGPLHLHTGFTEGSELLYWTSAFSRALPQRETRRLRRTSLWEPWEQRPVSATAAEICRNLTKQAVCRLTSERSGSLQRRRSSLQLSTCESEAPVAETYKAHWLQMTADMSRRL